MQDIDVEDLVSWTLNEQAADKVAWFEKIARAPSLGGVGSTGIVCDTLELGAIVDRQGVHIKAMGARCHPDAWLVHEVLMSWDIPPDEQRLLLCYGGIGGRPDWDIYTSIQPKRHPGNGKIVIEQRWHPRTGKVVAAWCELDVFPSQDVIDATWATYSTWRAGLVRLCRLLEGKLTAHRVTGPKAPDQPWIRRDAALGMAAE